MPATAVTHADWLELWALLSKDRTASAADLARALQREAPEGADKERADRAAAEAITEIGARTVAAGAAYPFVVAGNLVTCVDNPYGRAYLPYSFMLSLSFFGWDPPAGTVAFPRRWFEELSAAGSKAFLAGESVIMSPPRTNLRAPFWHAIDDLCLLMGEGGGWREQPVGWNRPNAGLHPQDDAVDVVAWRYFADRQSGKLILFGQCATGDNWEDKLTELQPPAFCGDWMREAPPTAIIRAFFIPHRVTRERWDYSVRRCGLLFDRCRLAATLATVAERLPKEAEIRAWTKDQIAQRARKPAAA